jgi:hypothetical protein
MEPEQSAPLCNYVHDGLATLQPFSAFYPPMKRYHDSSVIITTAPDPAALHRAMLSPNPISELGWLALPVSDASIQLEWCDGLGRIVRLERATTMNGRVAIDASDLAPGSYVLRALSVSAPLTQRVVVAR